MPDKGTRRAGAEVRLFPRPLAMRPPPNLSDASCLFADASSADLAQHCGLPCISSMFGLEGSALWTPPAILFGSPVLGFKLVMRKPFCAEATAWSLAQGEGDRCKCWVARVRRGGILSRVRG